jgi:hypothetical protein
MVDLAQLHVTVAGTSFGVAAVHVRSDRRRDLVPATASFIRKELQPGVSANVCQEAHFLWNQSVEGAGEYGIGIAQRGIARCASCTAPNQGSTCPLLPIALHHIHVSIRPPR